MASGNTVVVEPTPRGKFVDVIVSGTPKPGTCMQIKASTEPVNGIYTYEVLNTAVGDGTPDEVAILCEDHNQGKGVTDAYVTGTLGRVYYPQKGEEVNVRKANISGTGSATEDLNIGEKLLIVDGTGMISPVTVGAASAATPLYYPFKSLETLTDQAAEQLVHCRMIG